MLLTSLEESCFKSCNAQSCRPVSGDEHRKRTFLLYQISPGQACCVDLICDLSPSFTGTHATRFTGKMRTCTLTNASSAAVHVGAVKPAARALHMTCTRSTLSGNRIPLRQLSRHARPASAQRRPTTMGLPIPIIGRLMQCGTE